METLNIILSIIQIILCIVVIGLVLLQQSKRSGLSGAIGGGAETFFGKNKASSMEKVLNKLTIIASIVLGLLTIVLSVVK